MGLTTFVAEPKDYYTRFGLGMSKIL